MCDIGPGDTGLLHYVGHADTLWDVKWATPGQSDVSIYGRQHQVGWTLRTICQFQAGKIVFANFKNVLLW